MKIICVEIYAINDTLRDLYGYTAKNEIFAYTYFISVLPHTENNSTKKDKKNKKYGIQIMRCIPNPLCLFNTVHK